MNGVDIPLRTKIVDCAVCGKPARQWIKRGNILYNECTTCGAKYWFYDDKAKEIRCDDKFSCKALHRRNWNQANYKGLFADRYYCPICLWSNDSHLGVGPEGNKADRWCNCYPEGQNRG